MASPLSSRLFWGSAGLVWCLIGFAFAVPALVAVRVELARQRERAAVQAAALLEATAPPAGAELARGDAVALQRRLAALLRDAPTLGAAYVSGQRGKAVAHTAPAHVGELMLDAYPPPPRAQVRFAAGDRLLATIALPPQGRALGTLQLEFAAPDVRAAALAVLAWPALAGVALLLAGTLGAAWIARAGRSPLAASLERTAADRADALHRQGRVIRSREALLRAMSEASPLATLVADERTGAVLHVNGAFAAMWGLAERAAALRKGEIGLRDITAHCAVAVEGGGALLAGTAADGRGVIADEVALRDGRVLRRLAAPVGDGRGGEIGRLYLFEDITARKRGEIDLAAARDAALVASRAKSEFLATMSHELRTPLHGVIGSIDLLDGSPLDTAQQDHLRTARNSADVLLDLISQILDVTTLDAGTLTLEPVDFDLAALCAAVRARAADAAVRKGLTLAVHLAPGEWALHGDARRLQQVLDHLVGNAVKFTDRGEVEVRVARRDGAAAGMVALEIEVADSGNGIPVAQQASLFEPFTQADGSTTRRQGGAGLGLAVARRLVARMGGEIGVSSAPSAGSTFWFTVTLPRAHAALPAPRPATAAPLQGHLLVAEDNPINQKVAVRLLQRLGCTADVVANGREATEAAQRQPYDAVLMDCMMPEMDGYAATAAIRRAEGEARRTPIIAMTANAVAGDRDHCLAAGMDDYLAKPVDADALRAVLTRHLGGR